MADKIRGITIQIDADTNPLMKAFKDANDQLKETDKALKDVNKLLKFDPSNVTLLQQKQEYLKTAIDKAKESLENQRQLLAQMPTDSTGKMSEEQKALARNIEATEQRVKSYQTQLDKTEEQLKETGKETEELAKDTKDAGQQFDETGKKASTFGEVLKANLSADAIKGIASGVVDLGKSMFNMGVEAAATADDILTLSTQFGLSTDTIQEFKYMAELTDTSLETVTGSLTKLSKSMASADKGSKDSAKAFEELGISIYDVDGNMRDTEDVFREAIDALGKMDNETERNNLSMQIFGKSAMDLNPLIAAGSDAMAEYAQEAHDVGYVLDNETLESLGSVDDAMQRAKNSMDAVKTQLGTYLAPIVSELTTAFVEWAKSVDWEKVGNTIKKVMSVIGKAFDGLKPILKLLGEIIGWVIDKLDALFSHKFELPKLKLPHFKINGSLNPLNWLKDGIPKISVDWYKKGMQGMVLDGATIFGMNSKGQLMGGGEAGREIIIGERNLMDAIKGMSSAPIINVTVNESTNAQQTAKYVIQEIQYQLAVQGGAWR